MYFNTKNNFYHGIMFHHFHDDKLHKQGQGSIDKDDFYELIKFIGRENILDAEEFFNRFKENKLKPKEVCFTFDDEKNMKKINNSFLEIARQDHATIIKMMNK